MKNLIIKITKILKIYIFLKKINLVLQSKLGMGHGHNLFLFLIRKKNKKMNYKSFLEIGSTREQIYGQGSTEIIAKYCEQNKINFISVDADIRNVDRLRKKLTKNKYFKSIHDKGENFLKNTNRFKLTINTIKAKNKKTKPTYLFIAILLIAIPIIPKEVFSPNTKKL